MVFLPSPFPTPKIVVVINNYSINVLKNIQQLELFMGSYGNIPS